MRDASELVAESDQQSTALFDLLEDPGNSEVDFTSNVNGAKVQADQLVDRANDTDVPDELKGAHDHLVETLEFRRDGLDGIAGGGRRRAARRAAGERRQRERAGRGADAVLPDERRDLLAALPAEAPGHDRG